MYIDRNISEPHPANESIYHVSNQPIQPAIEIPLRISQQIRKHGLLYDMFS